MEKEAKELKVIDRRMDMSNVEREAVDAHTPNAVILKAMEKNYSPELIEKMMDLQERYEKNQARKEYYDAFASFKSEAPPVKKDKHNKYFDSWYTSLGNLLDTYNPILGKFGLSVTFPTPEQADNTMTVVCRVSHRSGHYEDVKIKGPIDQAAIGKASGQRSRNASQDIKSTLTYYRSASCEMALGVAGTEASSYDNDGNTQNGSDDFISPEQLAELTGLAKESGIMQGAFLKSLKVETLSELPAKKYDYAVGILKARKGNK